MTQSHDVFDHALLVSRRNRVAHEIGNHAFLLERVALDFTHRLQAIKRDFPTGLNVGAYTGLLSHKLRPLDNIGEIIDIEPSRNMASLCDGPTVCASQDALPFSNGQTDLAISGLSLHLVNDLPGALIQIFRALKPDGLLMAAMLGGRTLHELREAWLIAEDEILGGASPRVAPFADIQTIGSLLQRAGFALPVVDTDRLRVTYRSPLALMRELKAMAASNALAARSTRPVTRTLLERVSKVYRERFQADDDRVVATFEIITATAWVPHESQQRPLKPGSATTRLKDALKVTEHPTGEKSKP